MLMFFIECDLFISEITEYLYLELLNKLYQKVVNIYIAYWIFVSDGT